MYINRALFERIRDLTRNDMKHKTRIELLASPIEELGELAREMKIQFGTYGNSYKKSDEGCKPEAVDLFIGAVCLYFADNEDWDDSQGSVIEIRNYLMQARKLDKIDVWKLFHSICGIIGQCVDPNLATLALADETLCLFVKLGGTEEEFAEILERKLNKWEEKTKLDDKESE